MRSPVGSALARQLGLTWQGSYSVGSDGVGVELLCSCRGCGVQVGKKRDEQVDDGEVHQAARGGF